jgi:hypothetical protein
MTEALGFPAGLTPAALALFSAAQGAARVLTGVASERALRPRRGGAGPGVPRPAFFVLAALLGAAAHLLLAASTGVGAFAAGVTLSGVVRAPARSWSPCVVRASPRGSL